MIVKNRTIGRALAVLFLGVTSAYATSYSVVRSFGVMSNATGFQPQSALIQDASGTLYGTTSLNEGNIQGTVFKINRDGTGFQVLKTFFTPVNFTNSDGANPVGSLAISGTTLYGTTSAGGTGGSGNIFSIHTDGSAFTVLTNFPSARPNLTNSIGAYPYGGLILSGSTLYGTTHGGGIGSEGTVFSVNTSGTGLTVLKTFSALPVSGDNSDGANPDSTLVLSGNTLYGTTVNGGNAGQGTVFSLNISTLVYSVLYNFTGGSDGGNPHAGLALQVNELYGTASGGGDFFGGTVFAVTTNGSTFNLLYTFTGGDDGYTPYGGVVLAGSTLYGTAYFGGPDQGGGILGFGTVYAVNTNGLGFTDLYSFDGDDSGANPQATLVLSGGTLYGSTGGVGGEENAAGGAGTLFAVNTNGIGFTNIFTFTYSDAAQPYGGLLMNNHVLYGTTFAGGVSGNGTVFSVNPDGSGYSIIKNFSAFAYDPSAPDGTSSTNSDGANPEGGLVMAGSRLYGTTYYGGDSGFGAIYALNSNGSGFTNLYSFTGGNDGADPVGRLVFSGSTLYGTASGGGANGNGTVFSINTDGTGFTLIKAFSATIGAKNSDGANPMAGLTLSGSMLYGSTFNGGSNGLGALFSINTGTLAFTDLHSFTGGSDGAGPAAILTISGSFLYGTASVGGTNNNGTVFMLRTSGANFTAIKNFSVAPGGVNSDGANPYGGMVVYGGQLYGTTLNGGINAAGTLFTVNTNGSPASFSTVLPFGGTNGANPQGALLFAGNAVYGTTTGGGTVGDGVVFALTLFPIIPLNIALSSDGSSVILTWSDPDYSLVTSPIVNGIYTNIAGATSPYTNAINGTQQFFQLEAP